MLSIEQASLAHAILELCRTDEPADDLPSRFKAQYRNAAIRLVPLLAELHLITLVTLPENERPRLEAEARAWYAERCRGKRGYENVAEADLIEQRTRFVGIEVIRTTESGEEWCAAARIFYRHVADSLEYLADRQLPWPAPEREVGAAIHKRLFDAVLQCIDKQIDTFKSCHLQDYTVALDPRTVTRWLKAMQEAGLIERQNKSKTRTEYAVSSKGLLLIEKWKRDKN